MFAPPEEEPESEPELQPDPELEEEPAPIAAGTINESTKGHGQEEAQGAAAVDGGEQEKEEGGGGVRDGDDDGTAAPAANCKTPAEKMAELSKDMLRHAYGQRHAAKCARGAGEFYPFARLAIWQCELAMGAGEV